MGLPGMGSGMSRGLLPGTGWVRRGVELPPGRRLPKGLALRVWRRFARPYLPRLLLLLLVIAAAAAVTVVPAAIFKGMIDAVSRPGPGTLGTLNLLALAALAVAVAHAGLSLWQRYLSSWVGEQLLFDLRRALFDHVQRMPLAFFTRTQTGALISRLNNDVVGAQRALTGTFGNLTANVVQVVAAVGYMFAIDWPMTLLVLSVLPLFVAVAKGVGRNLRELTRQAMTVNAEMNTVMTERFNVAGALLVKLFGDPRRETDGFSHSAQAVAHIGVRSAVVGRLFFVTLALMGAIGTAAVYWLGGRGVLTGSFTVGDVVAFALLVERAYAPLAALTNAPVEVLTAFVSFERVFEILDLDHPIADRPGAVELAHPRGEVVFHHVSFAYPSPVDSLTPSLERHRPERSDAAAGTPVLHDVSFVARPGQTVALVGPSGAGKTSICNLVARLYDVSAGAVRIDDHDVRCITLSSLAAAVGVVSQDPHLFHDTVAANLRYARPDATDAQLKAACRAAQIDDVVAALPDGYHTVVGERGYRLSGGEKQRLAIARVLLKDPAIVVLDEATSHLDSEAEQAVQSALVSALAGRTSLVIAHRLSTVRNADLILVMAAGRIVQRGTHDELVAAGGLYAELYRTQFARA
ncbi:MAG TPA: ABC transporter ATP-binding protein [Egibacteraceae bacterium]|nr:ABC transporter ATP-binding protein [Egibacteraceae bacterium]